ESVEGQMSDGNEPKDASQGNEALQRLQELRETSASARHAIGSYVSDLMDRLTSLNEQETEAWEGVLESVKGWRQEQSRTIAMMQDLERRHFELENQYEKAGFELAAERQRGDDLEARIRVLDQERDRLRSDAEAGKKRMKEADARIVEAKNAQRKADEQLNETLETLTTLGLAKAELERKVMDLEAAFEAVREERAGAEERWNATDEQRLSQIRLLRKNVEELERKLSGQDQERLSLMDSLKLSQQAVEQARAEIESQREKLSVQRSESKDRIEVLERQQEEFIATLVDDYDNQLGELRAQLEEVRNNTVERTRLQQLEQRHEEALKQLGNERDDLARQLEEVRKNTVERAQLQQLEERHEEALKQLQNERNGSVVPSESEGQLAELRRELDALRAQSGSETSQDGRELAAELERTRQELAQARMGVDQLLQDCERLNAENVRLKAAMKRRERTSGFPQDEPSKQESAREQPETSESRRSSRAAPAPQSEEAFRTAPTRRSMRTTRRSKAKGMEEPVSTPQADSENIKEKRTVGSYFLTGDEVSEETIPERPKRRGR
ncbi:MAG TPA: hypothetical protein PLV85_12350, partial [Polyangiaceae bacterium]|nr:hypothetical protein [Polyangiaceae bacterium]